MDVRVPGVVAGVLALVDTLVVTPPAGLAAAFAHPVRTDTLIAGLTRTDNLFSGGAFAELRLVGPGAERAAWSVERRPPWLTVDAQTGVGEAALAGTRTARGLAPGAYLDTLRVAVAGAVAPAALAHRLVVRAPLTVVPERAAMAGRAAQGAESPLDSVWVEVRGDWAATAALRVSGDRPVVAVDSVRTGSGWVRFRRSGVARAPGSHVGRLELRLPTTT
jgi:hypothetical protein